MKSKAAKALVVVLILLTRQNLYCQSTDSTSFTMNARQTFYSFEDEAEMILNVPTSLCWAEMTIILRVDGTVVKELECRPGKALFMIPFEIPPSAGKYIVTASIRIKGRASKADYFASADLIRLTYKPNEVKVDRYTGGMIVNKKLFFPFGFYCYSPVPQTLIEEEVVRGFNMISPYQKILPESLTERKTYMDRCAQLGMKVHYNLLSVSGGGGVGSKIEGLSDEEKREFLITEIETFRDHPALLGWYIADEPNGYKIPPEKLEEIYRTVKEYDPWHPVSIVFMAPFLAAKKYANALDIVMADPYPVPTLPVTMVGDITGQLKAEFAGRRAVWIVPQVFGGGELWEREPTLQEIRSMTWQSIIKGATGIQYFVRQGPNYFPKSTATWSECGKMAMEIAELTPWLLSDEETLPVQSYSQNILVSSRLHKGQLIVMAVNKKNEPAGVVIKINGFSNGKARLLFENRSLSVSGGLITDQLPPFGSQVYLISLKAENQSLVSLNANLILDPGFEDLSSPGIPSACYARPGGDMGATYFLDTREYFEGRHSLRIVTPADNKGLSIRFFPFTVKAGASYAISIWAKSDPEQRFLYATKKENDRLYYEKTEPQYAEVLLGDFGQARFVPDKEWRRYVTFVTIPPDTLPSFKTNLILKMPGRGVAWFDQIKVFEEKQ